MRPEHCYRLLSLVFLQGDFMSFLCLFWFILRQEIVVSFWAPGILKMSFCSSASIIGNICLISFCHVPQNWMTNKCTIVFFFTYLITLLESVTEIICSNCMKRNIQIYYNLKQIDILLSALVFNRQVMRSKDL